jgi:DNA-binding NtrC family response regulator
MAKILVVDDEVEFVGIMKKILSDARHQVATAYNVVEMGQKLMESIPHMIFLEEAKANWHLNKPVSKKQILETVDMLLSGKADRIE